MAGEGVSCPYVEGNHLHFSGQFAWGTFLQPSTVGPLPRAPVEEHISVGCQWEQIRAGFRGNKKQAHTFILKPILDLQSDQKPVLSFST